MSGATNKYDRRHQSRYAVVLPSAVTVYVKREQAELQCHGELVDLSSNGAKISLRGNLKFSETVDLQIVAADVDVDASVRATIVWVRHIGDSIWDVGCCFAGRLPDEVFDRLGAAGIVERRDDPRCPVHFKGVARWELSSHSYLAEITDYSKGGFCMLTDNECVVGSKVCVSLQDTDGSTIIIYGKVRWQSYRDGKYLQGCEFMRTSKCGHGAKLLGQLSQVVDHEELNV